MVNSRSAASKFCGDLHYYEDPQNQDFGRSENPEPEITAFLQHSKNVCTLRFHEIYTLSMTIAAEPRLRSTLHVHYKELHVQGKEELKSWCG